MPSTFKAAAFAELSRFPLDKHEPGLIRIVPPTSGYMRVHLTLAELTSSNVSFCIDVAEPRPAEVVGHVEVR